VIWLMDIILRVGKEATIVNSVLLSMNVYGKKGGTYR
jgi:hypothetical protein